MKILQKTDTFAILSGRISIKFKILLKKSKII